MRRTRWIFPVLLLVAVAFSGHGPDAQSPRWEMVGSAERIQAQPDGIVNGVGEFGLPSVVAVLDNNLEGICTGTLIGCSTVLTAAHCFCVDGNDNDVPGSQCNQRADLLNPNLVRIYGQHMGVHTVQSITVHPNYQFGVRSDLAIIRLQQPVTGVTPTPINTTGRPANGSQGLIAGFGRAGGNTNDFGIKRSGDVRLAACSGVSGSRHLCWDFLSPQGAPGGNSNTCEGDSGGPLFVDFGAGLRLAGVTSGGDSFDCLPPDESFDADVFLDRTWVQQNGGTLGGTCGSLPPAGSQNAPVTPKAGSLSAGNGISNGSINVPQGTTLLRVTLNGDASTNGADFDLYLNPGGSAGPGNAVCDSTNDGAFEVCEVQNPAPGTWTLSARRFSGSGQFQATATTFLSGGGGGGGGGSGVCSPNGQTLCLSDDRFQVRTTWRTPQGETGAGQAVELTGDTGYFWFFNAANVEMVVKVLDTCSFTDRFWVFAGGLTNVRVDITVTDTETGTVRTYRNPLNTPFQPIQDTNAFATCP